MKRELVFEQTFLEALRRLVVFATRPTGGRLEGARVGPRTGAGIEFADWRPYSPGDDARGIDWRAYARFERAFIRLRAREEASAVYLLVDASTSMNFGRPTKFTFARRVAGALAAVALAGLDAVCAGFARGAACELGAAATGADHLPEVLGFLEGARAGGETDLSGAVGSFLGSVPPGGVLLLLSDFWGDDGLASALARARERGFEGALVQVLDPDEYDPGLGGRRRLIDSETAGELEIGLSQGVREAYLEERESFFGSLKEAAAGEGFRCAALRSDIALEEAVLGDLRRAGVVR